MTILASLIPQPSQAATKGSLLVGLPFFSVRYLPTTRYRASLRAKPHYMVPAILALVNMECFVGAVN